MVLIFTVVYNQCNFGQRLQAYGLQQAFAKIGQKAYIVDKRISNTEPEAFSCFEHEYLNYIKYDIEELPKLDISLVVLGGDWTLAGFNTYIKYGRLDIVYDQLLATFPYTISYSSSGGSNPINWIINGNYKKYLDYLQPLRGFKSISVREDKSIQPMIQQVVGNKKKILKHIDPVFLLSVDDWRKIAKRPDFIQDDEVFDFSYDMKGNIQIDVLEQDDGIKLVKCHGNLDMNNIHTRQSVKLSPQNFLWLIDNCRKLITSSFHGIAFGLMFKKQIILNVSINRRLDNRISNIVDMLDLQIDKDKRILYVNDTLSKKIEFYKSEAYDYLKTHVKESIEQHNKCCFVPRTLCCYQKNQDLRDKSASGGFCAAVARNILNKGNGIVYGAMYSNDFKDVKYSSVRTIEDFYAKLTKSKYTKVLPPKFSDIKDQLESGIDVLFIGCPCHVNALKKYLNSAYKNLTTISLVCHGACSLDEYKKIIDKYYFNGKSKLVNVDMRPNHKSSSIFTYSNGSSRKIDNLEFLQICKQCEQCKIKQVAQQQMSDFFVGDFWDYKYMPNVGNKYDAKKGTNKVVILTQHGFDVWQTIHYDMEYKFI